MAYKGTAAKSATGASMSKYDVEVEARLKALEEAVKELQSHEHEAPVVPAAAPVDEALNRRLGDLEVNLFGRTKG